MKVRTVDICGKLWRLRWYRRPWAKDEAGACYGPPRREIRILETGDRKADRDTLIHEVLHAVEYEHKSIPHGVIHDMASVLAGVL